MKRVVMPLFAAVHNTYIAPFEFKQKLRRATPEQITKFTNDRKAHGYDSVAVKYPDDTIELAVFDPNAVKSLDNSGDDGPTGDIHFSRSASSANSTTPAAAPRRSCIFALAPPHGQGGGFPHLQLSGPVQAIKGHSGARPGWYRRKRTRGWPRNATLL
jgi:hypothetical protein